MNFLFNTTAGINGYDQYGHFLRAFLTIPPGCTTLVTTPTEGCQATWGQAANKANMSAARAAAAGSDAALKKAMAAAKTQSQAAVNGGTPAGGAGAAAASGGKRWAQPGQPLDATGQPPAGTTTTTPSTSPQPRAPSLSAARDLLDTVMGPRHRSHRGKRR